jgi:hypothetical protein
MRIPALGALAITALFASVATYAWTVRLAAAPAAMVTDSLGNVVAAVRWYAGSARCQISSNSMIGRARGAGIMVFERLASSPIAPIDVMAAIDSADVVVRRARLVADRGRYVRHAVL